LLAFPGVEGTEQPLLVLEVIERSIVLAR